MCQSGIRWCVCRCSTTCEGHASPSQGPQGAAAVAMVFGYDIPAGDAPSMGDMSGSPRGIPESPG